VEIIVDLCNQHHGSLPALKRMSLQAFIAGADAVKVQLMDSEKHFGTTDKKYRDVTKHQFFELADFCNKHSIELMATPFDLERLKWITDAGIKRMKIASRTVKEDKRLCEAILDLGMPTIVSTGACGFNEFPFGFSENIKYLFCVSKYPTYLDDPLLKMMPAKFSESGYTGYSDHTIGMAPSIKAYLGGAKIIEKHYTQSLLSQSSKEKGHLGSFDCESLREFTNLIKQFEIMEVV
jgi:N,N'-diacetyllegionaminate synthase